VEANQKMNADLNVGQRTGMTDGSGSTIWTNDARGRVLSETKIISGQSFTTGYAYNSANLPTSMTYPGGEVVNYGYIDRMLSLDTVSGTSSYVNNMTYDAPGRLRTLAMGNGVIVTSTYNPWTTQGGRLQSVQAVKSPTTLQNLVYTYDAVGNILSISDNVAAQTSNFTYDALNRLDLATGAYYDDLTYDSTTGNLTSANGSSLTYGDSTHKHAVTNSYGRSYLYDANGNMSHRTIGSVTYTLTYDAENRLVSYQGGTIFGGSIDATFLYDADGNRVQGTVNGVTIKYVGNYYEYEGTAPSGTTRKYYYAGGVRVAMRTNSANPNYFLTDHLGSTTLTLDNTGIKVNELRYSAWGMMRDPFDEPITTFTYTGQRLEPKLDILFYNARWYDERIGRFIQADSIIPQPANPLCWDRYMYVLGNPIRYYDPSGNTSACAFSNADPECDPNYEDTAAVTITTITVSPNFPLTQAEAQRYMDLANTRGWWNDYKLGNFTVQDYLQLLLSMEFSPISGDFGGNLQELIARDFYARCTGFCNPNSQFDLLRYIAIKKLNTPGVRTAAPGMADYPRNETNFIYALTHPKEEWKTGCGNGNAVCNWGNTKMITYYTERGVTDSTAWDRYYDMVGSYPGPGSTVRTTFYLVFDNWFALTVNQSNCLYQNKCK
jgi:RHS repeat-associated protein